MLSRRAINLRDFNPQNKIAIFVMELKVIDVYLELLSALINITPFIIPEGGLANLNSYGARQKAAHAAQDVVIHPSEHKGQTVDINILYLQAKAFREEVGSYLHHLLAECLIKVAAAEIGADLYKLMKQVEGMQDIFPIIYIQREVASAKSLMNAYFAGGSYKVILKNLADKTVTIREAVLKNFDLKFLDADGAMYIKLGRERLTQGKELQHRIYALNESMNQFNYIQVNLEPDSYPEDVTLDKKDYADLILCDKLLKTEFVVAGMEHWHALIRDQHEIIARDLRDLKQHLGKHFPTIFRLVRIINLYKAWQQILTQQTARLTQGSPNFSSALEIQRLLLYGKKEVLKTDFANQKPSSIIQVLCGIKQKATILGHNSERILAELRKSKNQLCENIAQKEARLTQDRTYLQAILVDVLLGITEQPMYQLGYLAHNLGTNILDQFSFLGPKLDEDFARKWRHAQGGIYLVLSFLVANWYQYSYHFIASGNRYLFAHVDWLIKIGGYLDRLVQCLAMPCLERLEKITPQFMQGIVSWLKDATRFDEIGILEKEGMLQWFSGLFLNLFGAKPDTILPHIFGYSVATTGAGCINKLLANLIKVMGIDEKIAQGIGTFVHFAAYPYAYGVGFSAGLYFFPPLPYDMMSKAEAMKIFGITRDAKLTDVHRRYRKLASDIHPDICEQKKGKENAVCEKAEEEMMQINKAFEALKRYL